MITQTNGNNNSEKPSWIQKQNEALEIWEDKVGLNHFTLPSIREDATKFIEMGSLERSKLSCEECAEATIILAQYSSYIGRAAQRQEAESFLLKERIQYLIGESMAIQKAYSPDERKALALSENEEAQQLDLQRIAAYTKSKRLYGYAERIDKISRAYEVLTNVRKRERQYG